MDFTSFIEAHKELQELSLEEQQRAYQLYLDGIDSAIEDWVTG
jgi:hypothetical protein